MWPLFKAEVLYSRSVLLGFFLFALPFFVWNMFSARAFHPNLQVMVFCVALVSSIMGQNDKKNKTTRIRMLLPVPRFKIALLRHSTWLLLILLFAALIFIAELIRTEYLSDAHMTDLLNVTAGLTIFISLSSMLGDLRFTRMGFVFNKLYSILLPLLVLTGLMIYIVSTSLIPISNQFHALTYEPLFVQLLIGAALVSFLMSIICFVQRRSFLD